VPLWFSESRIAPLLTRFHQRYPDIQLELIANDSLVDVLADGFDVVIRLSYLKDSELIAKQLGAHTFVLTASPDYLARHPTIAQPEDLTQHQLMAYVFASPTRNWLLRKGQAESRISVEKS